MLKIGKFEENVLQKDNPQWDKCARITRDNILAQEENILFITNPRSKGMMAGRSYQKLEGERFLSGWQP